MSFTTALNARPPLQGVIFDMDGTLTIPNLDFTEMYKRCNVPLDQDILKAISEMSSADAERASIIIEEMEAEGRQTLRLANGAVELGNWLHSHKIPLSLVTRNTKKTVNCMIDTLWHPHVKTSFYPALSRHDRNLPTKPHPAAIFEIQREWGLLKNKEMLERKSITYEHAEPGLLMVGDCPKNDIQFGKSAGVSTALVDTGRRLSQIQALNKNVDEKNEENDLGGVDIYVTNLLQLPQKLWKYFEIGGPLGHSSPLLKYKTPEPTTPATIAAVAGDLKSLEKMSNDDLCTADESGNTPLIWATNANHFDVVKFLIQKPECYSTSDINVRGYIGATAICRASRSGHIGILEYLIDVGMGDMNIANDKMQYPLHFAAFKKQTEAVDVLLERGVNTLVLDRKGRTPAEDTKDVKIREAILNARQKLLGDSLV